MEEGSTTRHKLWARSATLIGVPGLVMALFLLSLGPESPTDPEPPRTLPVILLLYSMALLVSAACLWALNRRQQSRH